VSLQEQEAKRSITKRTIVFVCRHPIGESLRSARALKKLEGVLLLGLCEDPPDADGADVFADLVRIEDIHNAGQLINAAQRLTEKHGSLDRMVTVQETLLDAVAQAGESLGLRGMEVPAVRRVLDKSLLKPILAQAGTMTARGQVITNINDARHLVEELGFPVVIKPLGGSGGLATWCIRSAAQLELALELMRPSLENALLAEDFVKGQELCIDTITIANEPRFYSICCYRPSILQALENPRIQWSCVMPRDISGNRYREFIEQGLTAVRALSVGNAITHMEGFLVDGGGVCFTDATLRPAGARIGPMLGFAYDIDSYFAWARVAVDGCFDGPWERKYAVGTIFLRGMGAGQVDNVDGFESVRQRVGDLLVEVRLPRVGALKSATYTGDGYITLRHSDTNVVEEALQLIAQTVRITYTQPALPPPNETEQWSQRLLYFDQQLNRPAWDINDSMPSLTDA
jgi:carbamoyl-phosphate synthase L subunit-like protein